MARQEWRTIRSDCRHYIGDRPCRPHKQDGVFCEDCPYYEQVETRLLVIKLGALGDVVRTAALAAPLRDSFSGAHLTWLTEAPSAPYLETVEAIDRVLTLNATSLEILRSEQFDVLAGLDLSDEATALVANLHAKHRLGFLRDTSGVVEVADRRGTRLLAMSHWDDLKRENRETYQNLMCEVLGLARRPYPIPDPGRPSSRGGKTSTQSEAARAVEARFGAYFQAAPRPSIGLNVGGAGRWQKKVWTPEGFAALSKKVRSELGGSPLLLYGPDDRERAGEVLARSTVPPYDTGGDLPLLQFAELLRRCDLVVTGDTLCLHLSLAVGTRVVCLAGPTSAAELELYGLGRILQGNVDCLGCYQTKCDLDPDCMNTIAPETVLEAVREELES